MDYELELLLKDAIHTNDFKFAIFIINKLQIYKFGIDDMVGECLFGNNGYC